MMMPPDVMSQATDAFRTIEAALKEAASQMADIVAAHLLRQPTPRTWMPNFAVRGEVLGALRCGRRCSSSLVLQDRDEGRDRRNCETLRHLIPVQRQTRFLEFSMM